ncbi:hypothetical protein GCM10028791_21230 [Echinicola sediminis]
MTSCNPKPSGNQTALSLSETKEQPSEELNITKTLPLETTAENLMGQRLRIRQTDSLLFVWDEESKQKPIYVFDQSGRYLRKAAERGDGPDKFPSIDDFFAKPNGELEILSTLGNTSTVYRIEGLMEKVKLFETDYIASSFTKLPNKEYLLYGSYNLPLTENRMVKLSPSGKITAQYLPNQYSGELLPMSERNFFCSDNKLFLIESFNNQVYRFEEDSLSVALEVDFGAFSIPPSFWTSNIMESFPKLNENGFANIVGVFGGNKTILMECMLQGSNGVQKQLLFYNHEKQSAFKVPVDSESSPFFFPIGMDKSGRALFVTYRQVLEDYLKEKKSTTSIELPKSDYDYPVIITVEP